MARLFVQPSRVSVLIPVYNRKNLVIQAVESALSQEIEGLQVTIVDNCSDDGTWELLQTIQDPRVRLMRNPTNLGLFGNFNRCGSLAEGDLTLFLCSDDRLAQGFLGKAVALMEENHTATLLSSRGCVIDSSGKEQSIIADRFRPGCYKGSSVSPAWFWNSYHYGENPLNYPSGVLFRTSALRACLPFRAEIGSPADIDLFLRVLQHGDLLITDELGCFVMYHDQQEGKKLRKAGQLIHDELALLSAHRQELEDVGAYKSVRRQAACMVLGAIFRTARVNFRDALKLHMDLDRRPIEMLVAAFKRVCLRTIDRLFGIRFRPYLQESASARK